MATTHRPTTTDVLSDRHFTAPHERKSDQTIHHPRWALPLLAGFALLTGGVTVGRMAWRSDQGGPSGVLSNSVSDPSVAAPLPASTLVPSSTASSESEGDEDAPLPGTMPFDEYAARKTLELRARGLRCEQPGQVDLKVSFAPSGTSTRTEVVSSVVSPAASCIVSRLEKVNIPPFQGRDDRTVSVSVAVR